VAQALLGTRSVSGTLGCWNPYFFPLEALTDIGGWVLQKETRRREVLGESE
jgi:hypothetical protein